MTQATVVDLGVQQRQSRHQGLCRALDGLPWTLRTHAVLQAAGLPLGEVGSDPQAQPASGSLARDLGHETLEAFVTGPQSSNGLGLDWERWSADVRAAHAKYSYKVCLDEADAILAELEAVTAELGRAPANAMEFHTVRDRLQGRRAREGMENLRQESADKEGRIRYLTEEVERYRGELKASSAAIEALEAKVREALDDVAVQVARARAEAHEQAQSLQADALEEQRAQLTAEYEALVERERAEALGRLYRLQEQLAELKGARGEGVFVPAERYEEIRRRVGEMKEVARKVRMLREALARYQSENQALRQRLASTQSKASALGDKVKSVRETARKEIGRERRRVRVLREQLRSATRGRNGFIVVSTVLALAVVALISLLSA